MTTINIEPDMQQKLALLSDEATDEVTDTPSEQSIRAGIQHDTGFIYNASRERGGKVKLFKVLQTNACRYACKYCFTSCAIRRKRTTFKPDELATTFISLNRARQAEGLFLSSGIVPDANTTMEKMLATVEQLRVRERYRGYIHIKLIPGADHEYIERAVQLADRVSLNLEAPNAERLAILAPGKEFAESMWQRMVWAADLIEQSRRERWCGARSLTTQFVVGAAGESDRELLMTVERAHRELSLKRAYFSAFHPIERSPFNEMPAEDPMRAFRLYQADFMLRDYGFTFDEFAFGADGLLLRDRTPKQAWADAHPEYFPVEINQAPRHMLLRIPGIGPQSAERIRAVQGTTKMRDLGQLKKLGVVTNWAAPYILLDGRQILVQSGLWEGLALDGRGSQ